MSRLPVRSALSVAVAVVRGVAGIFGRYVPECAPLASTALDRARWAEMVESASVERAA